jgi:HlyD family secretion protein
MEKKRKIRRLIIVLVIVFGIGAGTYFFIQGREAPVSRLQLYGNVDVRQIELAFHATGRIENLLIEEGDVVKPGQLVAEIDPVRYEAGVARASAEVAAQKQVLARLLAGSRPEEIQEARARVKAAAAALEDAKAVYERTKVLARNRSTSQQQLDDTEAAFRSAGANLEAALKLAERELADTKLYAPKSGVIQDRILEPGDMAFPATPVFTLALTNPVWIRAYVSEPDLGKIAPGMRAYVRTDSFPDKNYEGWIGFISPTAEFTPKQVQTTELRTKLVYRIRIYACNPKNELRLGMPVTVAIPLNQPLGKIAGNTTPCEEDPDAGP